MPFITLVFISSVWINKEKAKDVMNKIKENLRMGASFSMYPSLSVKHLFVHRL
jgi:hypothetical protein